MPELEEFLDFLSAAAVIVIVSIFVTVAWMSTYIRDQPVVATAVVVFQQESSLSPPSTSTQTVITGESSNENSTTQTSGESQNLATSQEPKMNQDPSSSEEEKSYPEDAEPDKKKNDSQPNTEDSKNNEKEIKPESSDDSTSFQTVSDSVQVEEEVGLSNSGEPRPIPEEGSCSSTSSFLRHRKTNKSCEENTIEETLTNCGTANSRVEAEAEVQYEQLPQESIRIKLKFLDDTQRLVRGQLTDEVGSFKRANFNPELSSNCVVRLIFNGQLLNRDNSTLGQYGLFDNCVVHCHISQPQSTNSNERNGSNQENDGLDLSEILSPLLLVIVAFLWYLRYEYSHIFNTSATIILVCLTAMLLISQYALTISFNISWGYDSGNNSGSSSSSSSSSSSNSSSSSSNSSSSGSSNYDLNRGVETNIVEPRIQQNSDIGASQSLTVESVEEETVSIRPVENTRPESEHSHTSDSPSIPESDVSFRNGAFPMDDASFTIINHIPNADAILLNS